MKAAPHSTEEVSHDQFHIQGLGGAHELEGEIRVNGAKNAVLKMLAGSVLFKDEVVLTNIPTGIEDVRRIGDLLEFVGMNVERDEERSTYAISPTDEIAPGMCP